MEEIMTVLIEHGYELLTGLAIAILTICGRQDTADKIRAKKKKRLKKEKAKMVKLLDKAQKEDDIIKELENDVGSNEKKQ